MAYDLYLTARFADLRANFGALSPGLQVDFTLTLSKRPAGGKTYRSESLPNLTDPVVLIYDVRGALFWRIPPSSVSDSFVSFGALSPGRAVGVPQPNGEDLIRLDEGATATGSLWFEVPYFAFNRLREQTGDQWFRVDMHVDVVSLRTVNVPLGAERPLLGAVIGNKDFIPIPLFRHRVPLRDAKVGVELEIPKSRWAERILPGLEKLAEGSRDNDLGVIR